MAEYFNTRNPILPLEYHVSDSEAHVMPDGRLYLYGSFDDRDNEFCSEKYHVVSTSDMAHWIVHPVSMNGEDVPWFNDPNAPKYQGIDWYHPTPFIMKMIQGMNIAEAQVQLEAEQETPKSPMLFALDAIYKAGKYYLYFCMSDDSEGVAVSDKPEGPFINPVQLPCGGISSMKDLLCEKWETLTIMYMRTWNVESRRHLDMQQGNLRWDRLRTVELS